MDRWIYIELLHYKIVNINILARLGFRATRVPSYSPGSIAEYALVQIMSLTFTVCPRSSDPFYVVPYYMKWVTTSWTHCIC